MCMLNSLNNGAPQRAVGVSPASSSLGSTGIDCVEKPADRLWTRKRLWFLIGRTAHGREVGEGTLMAWNYIKGRVLLLFSPFKEDPEGSKPPASQIAFYLFEFNSVFRWGPVCLQMIGIDAECCRVTLEIQSFTEYLSNASQVLRPGMKQWSEQMMVSALLELID